MQGLRIVGDLWSQYYIYFTDFQHITLFDCSVSRLQVSGYNTVFTINRSKFQNLQNNAIDAAVWLSYCNANIQGSHLCVYVCIFLFLKNLSKFSEMHKHTIQSLKKQIPVCCVCLFVYLCV